MIKITIMHGVKYTKRDSSETYFYHVVGHYKMLRYYPREEDKNIYTLEVSVHENQDVEKKVSGFGLDYWGWLKAGANNFTMVYPSYPQFTMCFAGGYKESEKQGFGKAYRLSIKEIGVIRESDPRWVKPSP